MIGNPIHHRAHLRRHRRSGLLAVGAGLLGCLALIAGPIPPALTSDTAPRVLLVGGGPQPESNQVGIESNIRYVAKLLPTGAERTVLFADGNPTRATVQYAKGSERAQTPGERAFSLIFFEDMEEPTLEYRPPSLPQLDGPTRRASLSATFERLKGEMSGSARPLFLYFTGHGTPSDGGGRENTRYDLWGGRDALRVKELAAELKKVPESVPVTLVMVQCFSGGFANLIFEDGDPKGPLSKRDFAGFFAATPNRYSAGCTPAVNEAEYKDFTSYFFAALSGVDRVGRKVTGADYNKDGRVGMDEAFAYTLIADESIDVPVCTSEIFLDRFVNKKDTEVYATPYSKLLEWATPAQKAALEGLSKNLKLTGEDRLKKAFFEVEGRQYRESEEDELWERYRSVQSRHKERLEERWPALRSPRRRGYAAAKEEALRWLNEEARAGRLNDLFAADEALMEEEGEPGYSMRETLLHRFVRLGKSVALGHELSMSGNEQLLTKWKQIRKAEARSPLSPVTITASR